MGHKYICPICDGELKGMHYCKSCRKFIKEPWIFHGDSLPNERSEKDYFNIDVRSNGRLQRSYQENYGRTGGKLAYDTCHPNEKPLRSTLAQMQRQASSRYPQPEKKKPQSGGKVVALVFTIWFILVFVMGFLGALL